MVGGKWNWVRSHPVAGLLSSSFQPLSLNLDLYSYNHLYYLNSFLHSHSLFPPFLPDIMLITLLQSHARKSSVAHKRLKTLHLSHMERVHFLVNGRGMRLYTCTWGVILNSDVVDLMLASDLSSLVNEFIAHMSYLHLVEK
jgi:hypothetical protein